MQILHPLGTEDYCSRTSEKFRHFRILAEMENVIYLKNCDT